MTCAVGSTKLQYIRTGPLVTTFILNVTVRRKSSRSLHRFCHRTSRMSLRKFCEDTDTHGVRFLVDTTSSRFRRFAWALLISGSVAFLGYFFYSRISTFLRHEVTTQVTVSNQDVLIPSVRICMENTMLVDARKLTADDIINGWNVMYGALIFNESLVFRRKRGQRFFRDNAIATFEILLENSTDAQPARLMNLLLDVETSLLYGTNFQNWQVLLRTLVDHGSSKALRDPDTYDLVEVIGRTRYDYTKNIFCLMNKQNISFSRVGCNEGWSTIVGAQDQCFFKSFRDDEKVVEIDIAIIRESKSVLFPTYSYRTPSLIVESDAEDIRSAFLERNVLGSSKFSTLNYVRFNRKTEIRRLGPPFSECTEYKRYRSISRCVGDCVFNAWVDEFSCIEDLMVPRNESVLPLCPHLDWRNLSKAANNVSTIRKHCLKDCQKPCRKDTYALDVTASYAVDKPYISLGKPLEIDDDAEFVQYKIFSDSMTEVVRYEDKELYPVESMLAEIGGSMGLFIGISVLSVAHFLETFLLSVCGVCRQKGGKVEGETSQRHSEVGHVNRCEVNVTDGDALSQQVAEIRAELREELRMVKRQMELLKVGQSYR